MIVKAKQVDDVQSRFFIKEGLDIIKQDYMKDLLERSYDHYLNVMLPMRL